jgi:beta-alanine degradation protein BauB
MITIVNRRFMLSSYTRLALGATAVFFVQPPTTHRIPQFENDQVKVWRSVVMPNAPLPLHRHDHPRVIIALTGGTMKIVTQGGGTEVHNWESGKAYWLSANPPGQLHTDVNAGDKPIDVMVVELETSK